MATTVARVEIPGLAKRLLCPSFSDLFFLLIIVWSFLAGANGWQRLLLDGDTGIHIRVGDYILANHQVPAHDLFSFSKPGQQWYAFEWLSEVLFSFLHGRFGFKGVVLVSGIVIAATFAVLLRYAIWRGSNSLIAMALVMMTVNATSIHFHARPHIFTLLFLTVAVWLLAVDRQKRTRAVWLLVPLTTLWTNMHGGFFMFLALLGLLVIGCALEAYFRGGVAANRWSETVRYCGLGLACGLASLINPYGIRLHFHIFDIVHSKWVADFIDEFKSPSFRSEQLLHFMILLFLGLAVVWPLLARRRITETLWVLFLAYCSLMSVRHVPLYMLVAAPIVAVEISGLWNRWARDQPKHSVPRILDDLATEAQGNFRWTSMWAPLALLFLSVTGSVRWPTGFPEELFPVQMIRRHADRLASARVFTADQWADYLIYLNYPRQRVFLDGRHQYYGERIATDYMKLGGGHHTWQTLIDRYQFDVVLCPVDLPLASLLKYDARWRIVEDDGKTILFERTAERAQARL